MVQVSPDEYLGPFSEVDQRLRAAGGDTSGITFQGAEQGALNRDERQTGKHETAKRVSSPLPPSSPPSDTDSDSDSRPRDLPSPETGSDLPVLSSSPQPAQDLLLQGDDHMQDVEEDSALEVESHAGHRGSTECVDALMEETQGGVFFLVGDGPALICGSQQGLKTTLKVLGTSLSPSLRI
jgi:hypothetical protein